MKNTIEFAVTLLCEDGKVLAEDRLAYIKSTEIFSNLSLCGSNPASNLLARVVHFYTIVLDFLAVNDDPCFILAQRHPCWSHLKSPKAKRR